MGRHFGQSDGGGLTAVRSRAELAVCPGGRAGCLSAAFHEIVVLALLDCSGGRWTRVLQRSSLFHLRLRQLEQAARWTCLLQPSSLIHLRMMQLERLVERRACAVERWTRMSRSYRTLEAYVVATLATHADPCAVPCAEPACAAEVCTPAKRVLREHDRRGWRSRAPWRHADGVRSRWRRGECGGEQRMAPCVRSAYGEGMGRSRGGGPASIRCVASWAPPHAKVRPVYI